MKLLRAVAGNGPDAAMLQDFRAGLLQARAGVELFKQFAQQLEARGRRG